MKRSEASSIPVYDFPITKVGEEKVCESCKEFTGLRIRMFPDHEWAEYCPKCGYVIPINIGYRIVDKDGNFRESE